MDFLRKRADQDKWRYQSVTVFLTYKSHIDKDKLYDFINEKREVKKYIICHEQADETDPYEHTHACFKVAPKFDTTNERFFDFDGIHPNIGAVRIWDAAVTYCFKEDKSPLTNLNRPTNLAAKIDNILGAEDTIDAIKHNAKNLSEVIPIIQLRGLKRKNDFDDVHLLYKDKPLKPWQESFHVDVILRDCSDRLIHWVKNDTGNIGKTWYSNWCYFNGVDAWNIPYCGKASDIFSAFEDECDEKGCSPRIIIVDISFTIEDGQHNGLYQVLEAWKNGLIFSPKYRSRVIRFRAPTVVVMANIWPNTNKLAEDRWRLWEVEPDARGDISLAQKTINQVYNKDIF